MITVVVPMGIGGAAGLGFYQAGTASIGVAVEGENVATFDENGLTADIIPTGLTLPVSLNQYLADFVDIRMFGAACDGVTNDDAAFTAAFTGATSNRTILIPQGATCLISGTVSFTSAFAVSLVGAASGSSVIKFASGLNFPATTFSVFRWSGGSVHLGGTISDLTFDLNGATQTAATETFTARIVHSQLATGMRVQNCRFINSNPGIGCIVFDGTVRAIIRNNYFQQTASANNGKAIWIGSSAGVPSYNLIDGNVLVGTNMLVDGTGNKIIGNDVSGWGYGAGIGVGISTANVATNLDAVVIGNYLHDSRAGTDASGVDPNGIENWSQRSLITGNIAARNWGYGIGNGGAYSLVDGNTCFDNGGGGVKTAGFGSMLAGAVSGSNGIFSNNRAYDTGGGVQLTGYKDSNNNISGVGFVGNTFIGPNGAYDLNDPNRTTYTFSPPLNVLSVDGVLVGNGADTTEDTLKTVTLAAKTLNKVGDTIHISAGGTFAASTDVKTLRVKFGGTAVISPPGVAAGEIKWGVDIWITKTGLNTQSYNAIGRVLNSSNDGTSSGTLAITETAAIAVVVTGQNATNSVASSVTVQMLRVELIHAA